jgi:hypothetical protein
VETASIQSTNTMNGQELANSLDAALGNALSALERFSWSVRQCYTQPNLSRHNEPSRHRDRLYLESVCYFQFVQQDTCSVVQVVLNLTKAILSTADLQYTSFPASLQAYYESAPSKISNLKTRYERVLERMNEFQLEPSSLPNSPTPESALVPMQERPPNRFSCLMPLPEIFVGEVARQQQTVMQWQPTIDENRIGGNVENQVALRQNPSPRTCGLLATERQESRPPNKRLFQNTRDKISTKLKNARTDKTEADQVPPYNGSRQDRPTDSLYPRVAISSASTTQHKSYSDEISAPEKLGP